MRRSPHAMVNVLWTRQLEVAEQKRRSSRFYASNIVRIVAAGRPRLERASTAERGGVAVAADGSEEGEAVAAPTTREVDETTNRGMASAAAQQGEAQRAAGEGETMRDEREMDVERTDMEPEMMQCVIPAGVGPGQAIRVQTPRGEVSVTVPEGLAAGDRLSFRVQ